MITFCPAWVIVNCQHDTALVLKRCFLNKEKINNILDTCIFNPCCCLIMSMAWLSRKILRKKLFSLCMWGQHTLESLMILPWLRLLFLFHVHNAVSVHLISWEPVLAVLFSIPYPSLLQFQNCMYKHLHIHLANLSSCINTNSESIRNEVLLLFTTLHLKFARSLTD